MASKIIHHRTAGVLPAATALCNSLGLAEYVIQFIPEQNFVTIVLCVPDEKVHVVWRKLGRSMHNCPVDPLKIVERLLP